MNQFKQLLNTEGISTEEVVTEPSSGDFGKITLITKVNGNTVFSEVFSFSEGSDLSEEALENMRKNYIKLIIKSLNETN